MKKCSVSGCNDPYLSRSFCRLHYQRWKQHGDPLYERTFKKDEKCPVKGCDRKQVAKGYCNTHYRKIKNSGTLKDLRWSPEWYRNMSEAQKTDLSKMDSTPDRGKDKRGTLANNTVNDIKYKARKRGIPWELTNIEAYEFIIADCHWCGIESDWPNKRNGIDRLDNTKGYTKRNCTTACFTCNSAKGSKTGNEFLKWLERAYRHNR